MNKSFSSILHPTEEATPHTKEALRLARMLVGAGTTKRSVALAGKYRLWARYGKTEILVGCHGNGTPLIVLRRGEL
jgi:hypothetical protein